jgi:hypothetical protein
MPQPRPKSVSANRERPGSRSAPAMAAMGQAETRASLSWSGSELSVPVPRTLLRFFINYSDALNSVGRYEDAAREPSTAWTWLVILVCNARSEPCWPGMPLKPLLALGQWGRASA